MSDRPDESERLQVEVTPVAADEMDPWERHLSEPVRGRKVIVAFEVLASMTRIVENLDRWGSERPLLLPKGVGTGSLPPQGSATVHMLADTSYPSMTEQVRARLDPERLLTDEARTAVEQYDPDGSAWWWHSPVGPNTSLLGRAVLGGRPPHQIELEDKGVIDELLDAIGAERAPSLMARAAYDDLMRATMQLLRETDGDQVVWAADASHGINGGGDFVRWLRTEEQARQLAEFFGAACDRVRVSAFLDGVPCSIHGVVLADGVVVLRPMELVSLRDPATGRFVYAGMGTTWDPPEADTRRMRDLARRMGEHLRARCDYRGAFGIDGVLTADGFRVTELNPRLSGGLTRLGRSATGSFLELIQLNALLGRDIGKTAEAYEDMMLELTDETRFVDAMGISSTLSSTETIEVPVAISGRQLNVAGVDDEVVGTISRGPSPMGTFIRMSTVPGAIGIGDRAAPLSVLLLDFADRVWGAGFGSVLMPPDVRR